MSTNFSDYIVYVDESGDHGLINIKTNYPIFVLVFCIFDKNQYLKTASQIQNMKFKYFGARYGNFARKRYQNRRWLLF